MTPHEFKETALWATRAFLAGRFLYSDAVVMSQVEGAPHPPIYRADFFGGLVLARHAILRGWKDGLVPHCADRDTYSAVVGSVPLTVFRQVLLMETVLSRHTSTRPIDSKALEEAKSFGYAPYSYLFPELNEPEDGEHVLEWAISLKRCGPLQRVVAVYDLLTGNTSTILSPGKLTHPLPERE